MNEVVLNFNPTKKLENNDIIVFQNNRWTNVSRAEFLAKYINEINEIKQRLLELDDLKQKVAELRGEY